MAGFLIALLVLGWGFYGLQVLGLNQQVLEDVSQPLSKWFKEPGNGVRVLLWGSLFLITLFAWLSESNSFLGKLQSEITGITATVIIIDELIGYRSRLEQKQQIIRQIRSPVRDAAVEAVRLARELGFLDEALKGAILRGANLEGAYLGVANLEKTDLVGANLQGAYLEVANLHGANLVGAKLQAAILVGANLEKADLGVANLQGAILGVANLEKADLGRANLQGAILGGANLQGAILRGANLQGAILLGAKYNKETIWPDGFNPKLYGAILVE